MTYLPDSKTIDFLYQNAPLVEVIAEVYWVDPSVRSRLRNVDPFYTDFEKEFSKKTVVGGWRDIEYLVDSHTPHEHVAGHLRNRYRQAEGTYPLVQIGPGMLTANITPPYNGWHEFEPFLFRQLERLFECYPQSAHTLRIQKLVLRYVDGFDFERFDIEDQSLFARKMVGIHMSLPDSFASGYISNLQAMTFALQASYECKTLDASLGSVKISPGMIGQRKTLVMEMQCEKNPHRSENFGLDLAKEWFTNAHLSLNGQFDSLISDELKQIIGPKEQIT